MKYDHEQIEKKWQGKWEKDRLYATPKNPGKKKKYVLDMFPYPSGAGLHVGHPEGYTATDIYSRYLRMNGYDVLHPMGWDAFGLPAENYAIKEGIHPAKSTAANVKRFKKQIQMLGLSYDWEREIDTSDPNYYKWTQWLFLKLYEKGLAYRKEAYVNWCPKDQTVLANEQVINGRCERCDSEVVQKLLPQWFFKITDYADGLLVGLDKIDWPESIKTMQRNWIGRSEGAEIQFPIVIPAQAEIQRDCLIIHGLSGHSKENWFPWLKNSLEGASWRVTVPDLPGAGHAKVDEWNGVLTNLAKDFDENSVIVGHSIGVPAALNLVQTLDKKIGKLILAGPVNPNQHWSNLKKAYPDLDWKAVQQFAEIKLDWEKITGLANEIIFYYSDNDKYIPPESVDYYKQNLPNATFKFFPGKGHFNRSSGVLEFPEILEEFSLKIKVFTTRPDTIFGATYMVLAPENPFIENWKLKIGNWDEVQKYIEQTKKKTELQRTALEKAKTGVELKGTKAINPATKEEIPVWIADYVMMGYGTGAIMAVPAHDERDFAFAKKYHLEIKCVVEPFDKGTHLIPRLVGETPDEDPQKIYEDIIAGKRCYEGTGRLINSRKFNGATSAEAVKAITNEFGKTKIQYRLRDWLISRQRYWGAPIPIIYCDNCGKMYPVPEKDLPVMLPTDVDFRPTGESPLARSKSFNQVKCPVCKKPARRDTDTIDTFVDSSWYWLRYTDPDNKKEFASKKEIVKWCPVDVYVGGAEHAVLHLMYARFICKALNDLGYLKFDEPFLKLRNQGLILGPDGQKMSKSRGNVISPDDVVQEYGADTMRMYEMFMGPLEDAKPWSTEGIKGVWRFLEKVWRIVQKSVSKVEIYKLETIIHKTIKKVSQDIDNFRFNTAVSALMILVNEIEVSNPTKTQVEILLRLLSPFAPHIAEELWHELGNKNSIVKAEWPQYDEKLIKEERIKIVVQVNGKKRAIIEINADAVESEVIELAEKESNVKKYLENGYKGVHYAKGEIINFVVDR